MSSRDKSCLYVYIGDGAGRLGRGTGEPSWCPSFAEIKSPSLRLGRTSACCLCARVGTERGRRVAEGGSSAPTRPGVPQCFLQRSGSHWLRLRGAQPIGPEG